MLLWSKSVFEYRLASFVSLGLIKSICNLSLLHYEK